MNKESLKKIIKTSELSDKSKAELNQLIDEKKAKATIDFDTLTKLEKNKEKIFGILNKLKDNGLNFKSEISGKAIIVYLLYQEFEIRERLPIRDDKLPEKKKLNPTANFKKTYLKLKLDLSKMNNKPAFNMFGGYFKFYTHLRQNFLDKLIVYHPTEFEFQNILDIVLKQVLDLKSKEKIEEIYKGSILEFKAEKDEKFRENIFKSGKKELFFRLDYRKNDFSKEDAKKTAELFENTFVKSIKEIYGDQENLLLLVLEAVDTVSNSKTPKQAMEYLQIIFPKIISEQKNKPNALINIKEKIQKVK